MGSIPPQFAALEKLRLLALSSNNFSPPIPTQVAHNVLPMCKVIL
jgi:hypothetical protein